jgi:hypothetical protein
MVKWEIELRDELFRCRRNESLVNHLFENCQTAPREKPGQQRFKYESFDPQMAQFSKTESADRINSRIVFVLSLDRYNQESLP